MKVPFEKISAAGLPFSFTEKDTWLLAILKAIGEPPKKPEIRAQLELSASGTTVRVRGSGEAVVLLECARCVQPVRIHIKPSMDLGLIPATVREQIQEPTDEMDLASADIEEYTYNGKEIDLGEILNEQFTLAQPYRVLCEDDCRGLCEKCGANLNKNACECKTAEVHPAFASLADFKVKE